MRRGRDFWIVETEEALGTVISPMFFNTEQDAVEQTKSNPETKGKSFTVYQVKVTGKKRIVDKHE